MPVFTNPDHFRDRKKRQNSSTLAADYGKCIDFTTLKILGVLDIGLGNTEMYLYCPRPKNCRNYAKPRNAFFMKIVSRASK